MSITCKGGLLLFLSIFIFSCNQNSEKSTEQESNYSIKVTPKEVIKEERIEEVIGKAIWGYRFKISGDFDGDGKIDTLTEKFVSLKTRKETNKFYENIPVGSYAYFRHEIGENYSFLVDNASLVDTLKNIGDFGLAWLEKIGDIDGNGTDEIGFVCYHDDNSSINTFQIYTFNKKWEKMYSFEIRDWALPKLPQVNIKNNLQGVDEGVPLDIITIEKLEKEIEKTSLVKLLRQKTISYKGIYNAPCSEKYIGLKDRSEKQEFIWVKSIGGGESSKVRDKWLKVELSRYHKEKAQQVISDALKGTLEICDPGMTYDYQVVFK